MTATEFLERLRVQVDWLKTLAEKYEQFAARFGNDVYKKHAFGLRHARLSLIFSFPELDEPPPTTTLSAAIDEAYEAGGRIYDELPAPPQEANDE